MKQADTFWESWEAACKVGIQILIPGILAMQN